MSNFIHREHGTPLRESPTDWWRAAGDTNLRSIRSLTLVSGRERLGLTLHYDRKNVTVESRDGEVRISASAGCADPSVKREIKLVPLVASIKENGLHVQVLERVLAVLESKRHCRYLRDYSALE